VNWQLIFHTYVECRSKNYKKIYEKKSPDHLSCEVRGWNTIQDRWDPVPLYPRDILGELYRDQWRDTYPRMMKAKVEIPKNVLQGVI
jgi:hypothetical protein